MRSTRLSGVVPVPGLDPGIVAGIHVYSLPTLPRMRGVVGRGDWKDVDGLRITSGGDKRRHDCE